MLRLGIANDVRYLRYLWWRGVYRVAYAIAVEALWRAACISARWE